MLYHQDNTTKNMDSAGCKFSHIYICPNRVSCKAELPDLPDYEEATIDVHPDG